MKKILAISFFVLCAPAMCFAAGFEHDLFFGMRGNAEIAHLQEFLRDQGLYAGPVTGNFFQLTQAAVKKFQEREHIVPAAGYFGVRTRARASDLDKGMSLGTTPAPTVSVILSQLQSLQSQLKTLLDLQAQQKAASSSPAAATSTPPAPDMPAPIFTRAPQVSDANFVSNSPFGPRYPYRMHFDWATDAQGVINESVTCAPSLKIDTPAGHATSYFPEAHANYSCTVGVKNQAGKETSAGLSFITPSWVSVSGSTTALFPDVAVSPLKIGDIAVYNGSTSDILFSNFEMLLSDMMDSAPNRNHKVYLIMRDGTTTNDAIISKTDFTFVTASPTLGSPYTAVVMIPFPITVAAGQERKVSLWVEQLQYVKSGTLEFASTKTVIVNPGSPVGSFDFLLTRPPGL